MSARCRKCRERLSILAIQPYFLLIYALLIRAHMRKLPNCQFLDMPWVRDGKCHFSHLTESTNLLAHSRSWRQLYMREHRIGTWFSQYFVNFTVLSSLPKSEFRASHSPSFRYSPVTRRKTAAYRAQWCIALCSRTISGDQHEWWQFLP
jgi:hypothetical protein